MAKEPTDDPIGADNGAQQLLARAAAADLRARARLKAVIADIFLPPEARLDDRTRAAIDTTMNGFVVSVEGELCGHAARLLDGRGEQSLAAAVRAHPGSVASRLWQAGLPRDPDFLRELVARVRLDLLAELLPATADDDPDRASLLPRLVELSDRVVASGAKAVMSAENTRRTGPPDGADLPAELRHTLVWWVAAALRETHAGRSDVAALDRALTEAAQRNLAAYDEGERLEALASRLASALDPAPQDYADLLVESLGDRRAVLFVAILAHGIGVPFDAVREIVLDPGGERLWLACRALDLSRDAIARIGLRLAEADAARDLERFADELDPIAAITPSAARAAIAPLRLDPDYRAALDALRGPDA